MDALDVFGVGPEVGGVVDFVLEELLTLAVASAGVGTGLTMPVTLFAMKFAGCTVLSLAMRK